MSHRARQFRLAALVACASLAPATATAQLGKLKKAAADAAKEKAGVKADASTASASSDYVITADRLAAVMVVMEAGVERAAREAAAKAVTLDYNTKRKAYETCVENQLNTLTGKAPSVDAMQKAAADAQKTADMAQRISAAQQAKRYREYIAGTDTMTIMSVRSSLVMYGLDTKCGAPVYMPLALVDESAAKMARANSGQSDHASNEVNIPPAQRAGMTTQQFGMIRERAALWALQQTNNAPADNNKYGVFTKNEHAVLDAQGAKLKKWAPVFKDSPSTWAGWGDIKSW